MYRRELCANVESITSVHWERRLFDSLIPLPDGTSYNAYIVNGSEKTAIIDSADPELKDEFFADLQGVEKVDYIISLHAEQDHSGLIPELLEAYPEATLLCSDKAKDILISHLCIAEDKIQIVKDEEELSLGDLTLKFLYTPWVHWPETMCAYLVERKCLFSCDLFGSHLATSELFATDKAKVYEAAKRYYSEIMMPFRTMIVRHLEKLSAYQIDLIAPSDGRAYNAPSFIVDAYKVWSIGKLDNKVIIPYISMHGSTDKIVKYLADALVKEGVAVQLYELTSTDIGYLAADLISAATIVVASPTVQLGPHPGVQYAVSLANSLRPRAKYAAVLISYGWATKALDQIAASIPNMKVEILGNCSTKVCRMQMPMLSLINWQLQLSRLTKKMMM